MKIDAIKTRLVHAGECSIETLLAESLPSLEENSIVAISSKVVALCENRVVDTAATTKDELIKQEADYHTPREFSNYNYCFTIVNNTFIPAAGIDESNADGFYVLWPKDPQTTANAIRASLRRQYSVKNVGVIITDSTCMPPLRAGTVGVMLAHSGFAAVKELRGQKDLFGRPFKISQSAIGGGLAAAANVLMGEGTERTPVAVISDVPFVSFQAGDPTQAELDAVYISPELDLYAPFIQAAPWQKGKSGSI